MKLFEAIANIFRIPDLRKRVLFTFLMLAVYRFGSFVPTPGIDVIRWQDFLQRQSGSIFGFFDLFAGLSRDPADCPSVIHRHALFFVRHLYVFRAAQRKSMTIRARERSRYWRGSAHDFALLGREGFLPA